jgi:PBSX family phage portal protein
MRVRRDAVNYENIQVQRFFRRFVRITGIVRIYYKEMGDPRTVSRMTGRYYESVEHLKADEGETAQPANELMHWKIPSQMSPYGTPRWIGALLSVLGSRAAEEVNFLYFDNKAIPPMILMVSGGRLVDDSVTKIESYFQERLKGRENFHKIMVIEALPTGASDGEGDPSGRMKMELQPLMGQMQKDQMFGEYDASNTLKIGRAFRLPSILTGETRDMNRSTSETAKALAEEQIYQPARDVFDAVMDRIVLPNQGTRFWRFKTGAPVQRIPADLVSQAMACLGGGAITPNEARALLSDAFSRDLIHRSEDWANIPPALAAQAAGAGAMPSAEPVSDDIAASMAGALDEAAPEGAEAPQEPSDEEVQKREACPACYTRKRAQAQRALKALAGLRNVVQTEIEKEKNGFFDPAKIMATRSEERDRE